MKTIEPKLNSRTTIIEWRLQKTKSAKFRIEKQNLLYVNNKEKRD